MNVCVQVVGAMRDLFQAVFELRKKEGDTRHNMPPFGGTAFLMGTGSYVEGIARQIKVNDLDWQYDRPPSQEVTYIPPAQSDALDHKMTPKDGPSSSVRENGVGAGGSASATARQDAIADLLDLEFETNNLHSPSASKEDLFGSDPFGDSFTKAPAKASAVVSLPPPPSADGTGTHRRRAAAGASSASAAGAAVSVPTSASAEVPAAVSKEEKHWFDQETEALFDESELVTPPLSGHSGGVPAVRLEQVSDLLFVHKFIIRERKNWWV